MKLVNIFSLTLSNKSLVSRSAKRFCEWFLHCKNSWTRKFIKEKKSKDNIMSVLNAALNYIIFYR